MLENTLVLAKNKAFGEIRFMRASVLGIGTELTSGQIVNKNASWISAQLKKIGVNTTFHTVVPDDRTLITHALNVCAAHSDWIFITGGLGPTTDDFTRDVVAEWSGQKTFFHEPSWQHVQDRLTSRGFVVRDFQRQQCFYPETSTVLTNSHGTANGFRLKARQKELFVLPGPPREIEAIWRSHISAWLFEQTKNLDKVIVKSWDLIGLGESDVADLAENILKQSEIEKGYRVHLPYVEFKLTYLQSEESLYKDLIQKIDLALSPHTLVKDGIDLAELVGEKLSEIKKIYLYDQATGSHLIHRLNPSLRSILSKCEFHYSNKSRPMETSDGVLIDLSLKDKNTMKIHVQWPQKATLQKTISSPFQSELMAERRPQYFAEMALAEMAKI